MRGLPNGIIAGSLYKKDPSHFLAPGERGFPQACCCWNSPVSPDTWKGPCHSKALVIHSEGIETVYKNMMTTSPGYKVWIGVT